MVLTAQSGDREALEKLLHEQQPMVYAICRRIVCNEDDSRDATQNALVAIVRGLPKFQNQSKFSTWVYRIATNAALDEIKRRGRRPLPQSYPQETQIMWAASPTEPHEVIDQINIDEALQEIPELFRTPMVLRDLLGCGYAEIANILGIPVGTVKSRIARGRNRMMETCVGMAS